MNLLEKLANRVKLIASRGVIRLINDTLDLQELQAEFLKGEVKDDTERFQEYGFTSHPHPGCECIGLSLGGDRSHLVVIAADDRRYRIKSLKQGEVAIYTDEGDSITLKRGKLIEVNTSKLIVNATSEIQLNSPTVKVSNNLTANNTITGSTDVIGGGKSLKSHRHPETGSTTGTPN
jgi:phage baseplate assembly protein V